jgi:hypothetical protein
VEAWVCEHGPALSLAVLAAVPAALTKRTAPLRPTLKALYALAAAAIAEEDGAVGIAALYGPMPPASGPAGLAGGPGPGKPACRPTPAGRGAASALPPLST